MQINKRQFRKWIQALYSGEYTQTDGKLQDKKGFCCLGVGCHVVIPDEKKAYKPGNLLLGLMPNAQSSAPEWLKEINEDFYSRTGCYLTELNDSGIDGEPLTHAEIGMLLQLVYIHKMLY